MSPHQSFENSNTMQHIPVVYNNISKVHPVCASGTVNTQQESMYMHFDRNIFVSESNSHHHHCSNVSWIGNCISSIIRLSLKPIMCCARRQHLFERYRAIFLSLLWYVPLFSIQKAELLLHPDSVCFCMHNVGNYFVLLSKSPSFV